MAGLALYVALQCWLARHSSVVLLWQVLHRSASGVMGIGSAGWLGWKGPWQASQVTPSSAYVPF